MEGESVCELSVRDGKKRQWSRESTVYKCVFYALWNDERRIQNTYVHTRDNDNTAADEDDNDNDDGDGDDDKKKNTNEEREFHCDILIIRSEIKSYQ